MKTYCSIMVIVMIAGSVHAGIKKADRLFDRWEYYRAAQLYEREVKKRPNADASYKLGLCYMQMHKYREAKSAFDKVDSYGTYHNPEFYLNYGRILVNNERFTEAKFAFDTYTAMSGEDMKGEFYASAIDAALEDRKYDEPIQIKNMMRINTRTSDFCPAKFGDGIVFTSSRKSPGHTLIDPWTGGYYLNLYYAEKSSAGYDLSGATLFGGKNINQKYHDGPATFSTDNTTMYFTRVERTYKGKLKLKQHIEQNKIYKSELIDGEWSEAESFEYNSDEYSVAHPCLSPDGKRLYFASNMEGGYGESDIYYCQRDGDGWGRPTNAGPNVNTFGTEKFPFIDHEGNIFFASDGHQGFGGLDICVAPLNGNKFEPAKVLKAPFNSTTDDFGLALYDDGRSGFFSSDRYKTGKGDDDLYSFDLNNDDVDLNLLLRDYIIGYRPPLPPIVVAEDDQRIASVSTPPQIVSSKGGNVYFDYGKSELRPESKRTLDTVANYLLANTEINIVLNGYSDARGSASFNSELSNQRVTVVMEYLNAKGISFNRMRATSYGSSRIINGCTQSIPCNEEEHQLNRRVEYGFE